MIVDISKVSPGFAADNSIVYVPSFELGGDACKFFRGLMQAMISGKIISEDIKKEVIYNEKFIF